MCYDRFDEAKEQRVGIQHGTVVLGVVLYTDIPGERRNFDHFDEMGIGVLSHALHSGRFKLGTVVTIKLETVTVTLFDVGLAIRLCYLGAFFQHTVIFTQAHGSAHIGNTLLTLHQVDDIVRRIDVHLGRVGIFIAEHVTSILDDHTLHAQTDAKGGNVVLAGIFQCYELAFYATLPEARGYNDTVEVF